MGPCWEEVPPCVTLSLLYKDQVGWDENGLLLAGAICWECYFLKRVKWQRCFLVCQLTNGVLGRFPVPSREDLRGAEVGLS